MTLVPGAGDASEVIGSSLFQPPPYPPAAPPPQLAPQSLRPPPAPALRLDFFPPSRLAARGSEPAKRHGEAGTLGGPGSSPLLLRMCQSGPSG